METNDIFSYITSEESAFRTNRVALTTSKDWNMAEHIERCTAVAGGYFYKGANDGMRPYSDIVTPIINVAFRSEGFDVKDIVPFVNDAVNYYKSFLVKKFHPKWARDNEIDTFIDDLVETSIIYDLALIKKGKLKPEVIPLQSIAFCDQTDVLSGPICLKHQYSVSELLDFKGKWDDNAIDLAVLSAKSSKTVSTANGQEVKTPGKYIEAYELHGQLPEIWQNPEGSLNKYTNQLHIVTYITGSDGLKKGLTFFKGKSKELTKIFKALKIDRIKSFGRACGKSWVETLFEPQVWNNYSAIKIKKMLDAAALTLLQSASEELANQKLDKLDNNTVIKHEDGKPITLLNNQPINLPAFANYQIKQENDARILGSASDAQLGTNPPSGTPFALQNLVVQQGQGIHEYRQGKIATFVSEQLYKDWILPMLVEEMNKGNEWLEDLSLEDLQYVSEAVGTKEANKEAVRLIIKRGEAIAQGKKPQDISQEDLTAYRDIVKDQWMKGGNKRFLKIIKDELKDIPMSVYVSINSKQKNLAVEADKLTNLIRAILSNPTAFQQVPGLAKLFNQLIESSGMNPIDFTQITTMPAQKQLTPQPV